MAETKKHKAPIDKDEQDKVVQQVQTEFNLSYKHTQSARQTALKRLKLYNNQKKDDDKVGDPLLFSVFQVVLAALYEDKLNVRFEGGEKGDRERAENLNGMAKYDYRQMLRDRADYTWDWDTLFFGKGYLMLNEFDRDNMLPVCEVIDPMGFIRDPRAVSIDGDQKGRGAARFFGREIGLSMQQMEDHPSYFNLDEIKKDSDSKDMGKRARQERREAQNLQDTFDEEQELEENYEYTLVEWFTVRNGKKYLATVANGRELLVRYEQIDKKDKRSPTKWPVIERSVFPVGHMFDGTSIPDLIEDKQRARAIMINLGMESAQADLYPMYLYNRKQITNEKDLDFEFNKFVPVKGDPTNAVQPMQKSVFHRHTEMILNILDRAAQQATAAPEISQGVRPEKNRTLGESRLVMGSKNVRHSLAAKVFGWSERRFWRQWYYLYKIYFKEKIDEKSIRISGVLSPTWKKLTKANFVSDVDPDVFVESASMLERKREKEYKEFLPFAQIALQDPKVNRRYVQRKLGEIRGIKHQEMMLMFPPTIDEMDAEEENETMEDNDLPKVEPWEDDIVHIEIHRKAPDTPAKLAHIAAHKEMMRFEKENPELYETEEAAQAQEMQGFKPVRGGKEGTQRGVMENTRPTRPEGGKIESRLEEEK